MNRYISSRKLFYLFLAMHGISAAGILYYSFISLFIHDEGYSSVIFHLIILLAALTLSILLYAQRNKALSFLIIMISVSALIFSTKSIMVMVGVTAYLPSNLYCLVLGMTSSAVTISIIMSLAKKGDFMITALAREVEYKTRDSYLSWLKAQAWDHPGKVTHKKTLSYIFALSSLLLFVSFLSIAKEPAASHLLSVYFVLFIVSSAGIFLLVRQFAFLIEWRLADREIPADITDRWNSVITKIIIPVTALACAIPWKYRIIKSSAINSFFKNFFGSLSVNPYIGNNPSAEIINPYVPQPREVYPHAIRNFLIVTGSIISFHLTLALIGLILERIYRNKYRPGIVAFFIMQTHFWKVFLRTAAELFYLIALGFLAPIRAFLTKKYTLGNGDSEEVESQIYTFFNAYEKLSDAKKDEIRSIVRDFMRLIREAGKKGIPFHFHMGPGEFTSSIRMVIPESSREIDTITQIFNESRYSTHILSDERIKEFSKTVDGVITLIPETMAIFKD